MDQSLQPPRYVHAEGHVDLCYDSEGVHILTCGSDGEVRILEGFEDDDPISFKCSEVASAIAFHDNRIYVGCEDFTVKVFMFKEGQSDGIVTRFTAPVNHIIFSKDGKYLIAGGEDFTVKDIEVSSNTQKQIIEHDAPILSVDVHPQKLYAASSSCDGTIKVFSYKEGKVIKTIPGLPKTNDMSQSRTLCRLCFSNDGKFLAIPIEKEIKIFNTSSWREEYTLTDSTLKELISIVRFSPCGRYLAASCRDGTILIYDYLRKDCIVREKHEKGLTITGLCWNPKKKDEIVVTDNNGYLSIFENVLQNVTQTSKNDQVSAEQFADLFDDDDDDMLVDATNPVNTAAAEEDVGDDEEPQDINELLDMEADDQDGEDDDNIRTATGKQKVRMIDDDDSNDVDLGAIKKSFLGEIEGMDDNTMSSAASAPVATVPAPPPAPVQSGFQPTPMQAPFQSSSTPTYHSHRYMAWNSVGIVLQYNTEEENSINIEFHDSATHHAMHVVNMLNHTMADISNEAVVLACEADDDVPSQLTCMHFSSWDNCKEWSIPMPDGESIAAVCIGDGWIAAATDKRLVRVFTIGGIQRDMFSLAGPVVAMSGHTHQLLAVYHHGMGIPGDQCLGIRLQNITGKKNNTVINGDRLPLSVKSTLTWLGFSAEGTPFYGDSSGVVRMLLRKYGHHWTPVANLKKHCKGKSDNFWIVGIHENPQQLRAILCKGSKFPQTLPRPMLQILPFEMPFCEISTDKGSIEESFNRTTRFYDHLGWWNSQGFEFDETEETKAKMLKQEALMKLFALACKTEREFRAVELCEMMPSSHMVQLAIKYASRLRLINLAQRLSEVARQKTEEELDKANGLLTEEEEEEEEEDMYTKCNDLRKPNPVANRQAEDDLDDPDEDETQDICEEMGQDEETIEADEQKASVILLKDKIEKSTPKLLPSSQNAKKNPFKMASQKTPTSGKGSSVFDGMDKPKLSMKLGSKASPLDKPLPKPKVVKKKQGSIGQAKLFSSKKTETNQDENNPKENDSQSSKPKTGFQFWFDSNKDDLVEEHPDFSEGDLLVAAAKAFKELPSEEKQKYNELAKDGESKKRKRDDSCEEDSKSKKQSPANALKSKSISQNTSSKLASFSFGKS